MNIQNNLICGLTCSFAWLQPAQSRQSSQYQAASGPITPFNPGTQLKCTLAPQPRHELRASSAPEQFLAAVPRHSLQIGSALFYNSTTIIVMYDSLLCKRKNVKYSMCLNPYTAEYYSAKRRASASIVGAPGQPSNEYFSN